MKIESIINQKFFLNSLLIDMHFKAETFDGFTLIFFQPFNWKKNID